MTQRLKGEAGAALDMREASRVDAASSGCPASTADG